MKRTTFLLFFVVLLSSTIFVVSTHTTHAATIGVPSNFLTLSNGLVGWWTFDGKDVVNGAMVDKSGNGNTGNFKNIATSTFYVPGKIGQAGRFDGMNDYMKNTSLPFTTGITDMTISLWVKGDSVSSRYALTLSGANSYKQLIYFISGTTWPKKFNIQEVNNAQAGASIASTYSSTKDVLDGKWHQVIIRHTHGGTLDYFVDGTYQTGTTAVDMTDVNIHNVFVGAFGYDSSILTYFPGTLDDVRIYNRALSSAEIYQLYRTTAGSKQGYSPKVTNTNCSSGLSCGLVGYWTFDGNDMSNGVALDKSGNGNNGNLLNISTSTFFTYGKIGQGFRLDGVDDAVNLGDINASEGIGAISIGGWMKLTANSQSYLIGKSSSGSGPFLLSYIPGSRAYACSMYTNVGVITATSGAYPSSSHPGIDNTWYHVICTYDGSNIQIYVNGVAKGSPAAHTGTLNSNSTSVCIGATQSLCTSTFAPIMVDDVRIYNRALTAAEIYQLYKDTSGSKQGYSPKVTNTNCSSGLSCGLVGYWTFDGNDMSNGVALDKSGNGNNGNLLNISTSTFFTYGKVGQGFRFDGVDDYVNTGSDFIGVSAGTFSAWINSRSLGENSLGFIISNSSSLQFGLGLCSGIRIGFTSNNSTNDACAAANSHTHNKWYFVAATRDASGVANIYVNGELSGTADQNSGTPQAGTSNVLIGNHIVGSRTWDGSIDDVRVYNRVLSADEIRRLYNLGK